LFEVIIRMGYQGFFIFDGSLVSINMFSYDKHQKPYLEDVYDKRYVNNFFFISKERVQLLNY